MKTGIALVVLAVPALCIGAEPASRDQVRNPSNASAPTNGVADSPPAPNTAFSYQGKLVVDGAAYGGEADLRYSLWSDATSTDAGDQVAGPIAFANAPVSNGVFTSLLDFGAGSFTGAPRYLQVEARTPSGAGSFVAMMPRTEVLAAPMAQWSARAGVAGSATALDTPDGTQQGVVIVSNSGDVTVGTMLTVLGPIVIPETVRTRSMAPAAWVPGDGPTTRGNDGQYLEALPVSGNVNGNCFMPLNLPAGAVLRGVTLSYLDQSNFGDLVLTLRRTVSGPNDFGSTAVASAQSAGNVAAVRTLSLGTLAAAVDNEPLYLQAKWATTNADPIRVGRVQVTYSVTTPLP